MNKLLGCIVNITSQDDLSLIDINITKETSPLPPFKGGFGQQDNNVGSIEAQSSFKTGQRFTAILLEMSDSERFYPGQNVYVLFKETEVSIAKDLSGKLSIRNRVMCEIFAIEKGKILSEVVLNFNNSKIVSLITTRGLEELDLKVGDIVEALIKTNEITLMKADSLNAI